MSAPTGCSLVGYAATCDWGTWSPPLADSQFSNSPSVVTIQNVNGEIPSDGLFGLTNAANHAGSGGSTQLSITCGFLNSYTLTLLSDSLSSNLSWVQEMSISDCYNMNINDGALSYLTAVTIFTFLAGSFASLSGSAFSGMTNLQTLYLYAEMPSTGVPAGIFTGLTELVTIDMSRTTLNSIPAGLFDDLRNLTSLNIEQTGLTTLPSDIFHPLLSLTTLNIDVNSWTCDCTLQWLGEYLTSTGLTTSTCGSPAAYNGYDLQRSLQALTCTVSTTTSTESDDAWKIYVYALIGACSLTLIIATIACICCWRNRGKLKRKQDKSRDDDVDKDSSNQRDKDSDSANKRERTDISHSSNWASSTGIQSANTKFNMAEVENGRNLAKETGSPGMKVPPYIQKNGTGGGSGGGSGGTPRLLRASRVTPSEVNVSMFRSTLIDRKANIANF